MILRAFVVVLSDRLPETKTFYAQLFRWRVAFESKWFIHLQAEGTSAIELGILDRDHEIVLEGFRAAPCGTMVTIVVPDVDQIHARAASLGMPILEGPRNLFYGQRRMLLQDPNGMLVDVSSECEPSKEFLASMQSSD
jgi:predicted enzyme related to lactoylglutathione lyase